MMRDLQNQEYRFTVPKSRKSIDEGRKRKAVTKLFYKQTQRANRYVS